MKIYKIWQTVNSNWDTYDSAIVGAVKREAQSSLAVGYFIN